MKDNLNPWLLVTHAVSNQKVIVQPRYKKLGDFIFAQSSTWYLFKMILSSF